MTDITEQINGTQISGVDDWLNHDWDFTDFGQLLSFTKSVADVYHKTLSTKINILLISEGCTWDIERKARYMRLCDLKLKMLQCILNQDGENYCEATTDFMKAHEIIMEDVEEATDEGLLNEGGYIEQSNGIMKSRNEYRDLVLKLYHKRYFSKGFSDGENKMTPYQFLKRFGHRESDESDESDGNYKIF